MKPIFRTMSLMMTFMLSAVAAVAQVNTYQVRGVLIDSVSGETEPYATVRIFEAKNQKKPIKVDVTDTDGSFDVKMSAAGNYRMVLSSVGKSDAVRDFTLASERVVDLGKIAIGSANNVLGEIVVEAARPLVKADVDKLTYEVEADPDSKSNTLTEMLRKVPMVTVDAEDNIQVKGSSSFKVLVNGKPNTMMSNNPKEIFRAMPANAVKRIEVITDPGAKYDAEGVSGVLNIITGDAKVQGYNMNINARVDNRQAGGGAFVTAQSGKFTVSTNVNYVHGFDTKVLIESERNDFTSDQYALLSNKGFTKNNMDLVFATLETSYEVDSLNLITLSGNVFTGKNNSHQSFANEMSNRMQQRQYFYNRTAQSKSDMGGSNLGLDYQHSFRKPGEYLTLSYRLDYSPAGSVSDTWYDDVQNVPYPLLRQYIDNDAHTEEHTAQVDYVNPVNEMHYIDFGAKYIYRKNASDVLYRQADTEGVMHDITDPNGKYDQLRNIVAGYADYQLKYKSFGAKAGVRYEYSYMNVDFDNNPERNYSASMHDVVPSVVTSYMISPMSTVKLSYNMRINRPGIQSLNPFADESDPTNITKGNPDLDTEKSHNIELSFSRFSQKFMINAGLNYSYSGNGIEQYSVADGGVITTTYGNVSKRNTVGLNIWCNWNPWPKTRLMLSFNGGYNKYESEVLKRNVDGFTGNIFANIQQTLPHDFTISGMLFGNTGSVGFQNETSGILSYGFTFGKSFFKNKALNISIQAMAPFTKYLKMDNTTTSNTFTQTSNMRIPIRRFGISLSWRFGNLKATVKKTSRSINNDDTTKQSSSSTTSGAGAAGSVGM